MNNIRKPPLALRASVLALHGALALFASVSHAQAPAIAALDAAAEELVKPTNTVEAGVIHVDRDSDKFGEFNGLQREGMRALVDFEVRGGGAYKQDSGSVERWRVYGSNLGLPTRTLGAEYAQQGLLRFGFEYTEMRKIQSHDFDTIYRGAGTTTLTLPPEYPAATARTAATFTNIQTATGPGGGPAVVIPALVQNHHLAIERRRLGVGGELVLTPQWTLSANARTEKRDGTKLTGVAFGGFRGTYAPEPIDSETNVVEAAARFTTKDVQFGIGYAGSFFNNDVNAWSAQNPFFNLATVNNLAVLSSPPDNQAHQVNVDGGWRISPATKVSVAGSYTRMTQDDTFSYQAGVGQVVNSGATQVDAKQVQANLSARVNHQVNDKLEVTGSLKAENRDTQTPIGTYAFVAADAPTALVPATRTFNNLPQNRRQRTASLEGQYSFTPDNVLSAGYEFQAIRRSFDPPAVALPSQENPFLSGASDQHKLRLGYRHAFRDNLSGTLSYSHSRRDADSYFELPPTSPTPAPGVFPQVPAFRQFFLADRDQDQLRASVDFQVTKDFSLQGLAEYQADRYPSRYGLKKSAMQTWTLDGTYSMSDRLRVTGFVTYEDSETRQDHYNLAGAALPYTPNAACPATPAAGTASNIVDSCREWGMTQGDRIWTVGLGVKSSQFMSGKLTLSADVVYSRADTSFEFSGGTYGGTPVRFQAAQNMPDMTSTLTDLRLGARYELSKNSALRVGYLHRRLRSSDPQFDLFGFTTVQTYLGPGISAPRYRVNAISASYIYNWR